MQEIRIHDMCQGECAECSQHRKGVWFRFGRSPGCEFLCWEHFRLMAAALSGQRVIHAMSVDPERCRSTCPCCRCSRQRTRTWSHSTSRGFSQSESESHGQTRSTSDGESSAGNHGTTETDS